MELFWYQDSFGVRGCQHMSMGYCFEPIHNAIAVTELAVEKGAQTILFPVSARRQLNDLSDDMAARITIVYYVDVRDGFIKAITD